MIAITYPVMLTVFSIGWIAARIFFICRQGHIDRTRELQLLLVYLCTAVVLRLTFFPFSRVNGQIQPLVFDAAQLFPLRINLVPFVCLTDYPTVQEILLNVIGNSVLFLPYGIVFPAVFGRLSSFPRVMAAGFGTSLCIEILQLLFYDRVSDIDDLILNTLGYLVGYGIYVCIRRYRTHAKEIRMRKNR